MTVDEHGWDLFEAVQRTTLRGLWRSGKRIPTRLEQFGSKSKTLDTVRRLGEAICLTGRGGDSVRFS
jgi:hypothetical protein